MFFSIIKTKKIRKIEWEKNLEMSRKSPFGPFSRPMATPFIAIQHPFLASQASQGLSGDAIQYPLRGNSVSVMMQFSIRCDAIQYPLRCNSVSVAKWEIHQKTQNPDYQKVVNTLVFAIFQCQVRVGEFGAILARVPKAKNLHKQVQ